MAKETVYFEGNVRFTESKRSFGAARLLLLSFPYIFSFLFFLNTAN